LMAVGGEMEPQADQMARLRHATDSLAALTQQIHQLSTDGRRRTSDQIGHKAALSVGSKQQLHDTKRVMARLRPHLDQAEQRLIDRLDQVAVDQDVRKAAEFRYAQRSSQTESRALPMNQQTISGRVEDYVGDVQIDPSDPTWVKRTVFVKNIEMASANAQTVKDVCARVSSEGDSNDFVVSVSLRVKTGWQRGSWALVSFATERGAQKLLDEQTRKVARRLTGTQWTFLPYQPQKLMSHEAQARKFHSAQSARRWTQTGLVGHAIATMKQSREASAGRRTVWVGGVPDHLARGGVGRFEQNMKAIFAEYGTIERVQTRYKDVHAGSSGASWGTVTFCSQAAVSHVLAQTIFVPAYNTPRTGSTVKLELRPADSRVDVSPIGKAAAKCHIDAIHRAIVNYDGYLPSSHPTLVRMHAALVELHRRCGDEHEAKYSEQESKRLAKRFLLELERVGDCGVYAEDESFMRELLKDDKEVEESFRRRCLSAAHSGAAHRPRTNQLPATYTPGFQHEPPSRRWVDE
jgi:hypothetical protein